MPSTSFSRGAPGSFRRPILVGDDRVHLDTSGGNLIVRPAPELAGLIEIRGLGIRRIEHVGEAVVGLVVDLAADDAERLPAAEALTISNSTVSRYRESP